MKAPNKPMNKYPLYDKTKKFVNDLFYNKKKHKNFKHFRRTVYWVKRLSPGADESLLIAAYSHDVERAFIRKKFILMNLKNAFLAVKISDTINKRAQMLYLYF